MTVSGQLDPASAVEAGQTGKSPLSETSASVLLRFSRASFQPERQTHAASSIALPLFSTAICTRFKLTPLGSLNNG